MTDAPRRIQRSRAQGWRLPPNTITVSRPGPWGNPWAVWRQPWGDEPGWYASAGGCHDGPHETREAATLAAIRQFRCDLLDPRQDYARRTPMVIDAVKTLRGKNLACWCALDQPCHADVLLEVANGPLRWDGT